MFDVCKQQRKKNEFLFFSFIRCMHLKNKIVVVYMKNVANFNGTCNVTTDKICNVPPPINIFS